MFQEDSAILLKATSLRTFKLAACLGLMALSLASGSSLLLACSTFCICDNEVVFGRNFDWFTDLGLVMVNKRNVAKTAAVGASEEPAGWVSRYGSITFNQISREFPFGGMNEAGLVVELMWLDGTGYPEIDERPAVTGLQWIQYMLDRCCSVNEIIACDSLLRISPGATPLHYLVCDSSGNAATIEFLEGNMVCHTDEDLPWPVLTNSTYDDCAVYLKEHAGFGGKLLIPESESSRDRFVRAADMLRAFRESPSMPVIDYAFNILAAVAQVGSTQWSIVYDVRHRQIHFRTLGNPMTKVLDLEDFDFSCLEPARIVDINTEPHERLSSRFTDYTTAANKRLMKAMYTEYTRAGFYAEAPDDSVVGAYAKYPETSVCTEEGRSGWGE
jgi:penicillin V acylase-like amidase (Ntn superfamily)